MTPRENPVRQPEAERVVNMDKKRQSREESDENRFFTSVERREALGFVMIAAAIVLFASLALNPNELRGIDSSNLPSPAGKFGRWIARQVGILFGIGGLVIPLALGTWGVSIFKGRQPRALFAKALALVVGLMATCAFLGLIYEGGYLGGALGDRLAADLHQVFGIVSYLVVLFVGVISVVVGTPLSFSGVLAASAAGAVMAWKAAVALEEKIVEKILQNRGVREREEAAPAPPVAARRKAAVATPTAETAPEATQESPDGEDAKNREYFDKAETRVVKTPALKLLSSTPKKEKPVSVASEPEPSRTSTAAETSAAPVVEPVAPPPVKQINYTPDEAFTLPPVTLLHDPLPVLESVTEEDLRKKAQDLQVTLADFGVECKVGDIVPGPTVTRFEIVPAPGVKVSSITTLSDDIALAMAAPAIRIEAPIPGKSAVGIEIPNRRAQPVTLKEVITSEEFKRCRAESPLTAALGQDIAGIPVVADLRKMPHLLIAGATGSGKSVCINSIVNSILMTAKPTEVKMLMVDPKVVELKDYDDVPHLLAPVCTDSRKAPRVLMWAVEEMDRRYQWLAQAGVREIESYNQLEPEPAPEENDDFVDLEDELPLFSGPRPARLPYILVVVDEFSDLMMVSPKECEESITRIAQMARAVGIHLIIATQRPSVDVITGVIKANLPSRISFQVSSKVDSRTILDIMGAERLLGRGDMLFKPGDRPKPVRLQGCYIGGKEIKDIVKHYRDQGESRKMIGIDGTSEAYADKSSLAGEDDPLLEQAMRIALKDGMASVSRLQRVLKVGHPRAARLVDIMEAKGLVTAPDGSKPRKLLYDESYFSSGNDGE